MANIDRIVNVQISLRTSAITTLSFSDLLLLGNFTPLAGERVIVITDADELLDSYGVLPTDTLYRAAQVAFSQIPTVPQLFIGNKDLATLPPPLLDSIDPYWIEVQDGTDATPVTFQVVGSGFTEASQVKVQNTIVTQANVEFVNPNLLRVRVGKDAFYAVNPNVPVSVVSASGESAPVRFQVVAVGAQPDPQIVRVNPYREQSFMPPGDMTAVISAVNAENSDWYAFVDVDREEAAAEEYAAWAESNQKLFLTVLSTPDTLLPGASDTTSTAAKLKAGNYFRTAWWYNPDPRQFIDVAIACRSFTTYPGGETWANQRLAAVRVEHMRETDARNVFYKNGNTFEPFRNISITQNGKVAGGEWIDIIRFRDWLCEEIRIRVFQQMIDNRIPYTDPGIAIIRTRVAQALDLGVVRGGIAPPEVNADGVLVPSYTISVPLSMSVSANNKANRILQDVTFTARLAGAIHVVEIRGQLSYEDLMVGA